MHSVKRSTDAERASYVHGCTYERRNAMAVMPQYPLHVDFSHLPESKTERLGVDMFDTVKRSMDAERASYHRM